MFDVPPRKGEFYLPHDQLAEVATARFMECVDTSLDVRAKYDRLEQLEGKVWSGQQLVSGGIGNASELAKGMRLGLPERICEGHSDVRWSIAVVADRYFPAEDAAHAASMDRLASRYVEARLELADNSQPRELDTVRANFMEAMCALPRYAAALDGERTFPDADKLFEQHLGDALYWLTLSVPAANAAHGLAIDPEQDFDERMKQLSVRIDVQAVYTHLALGHIGPVEAQLHIDRLAVFAHQGGLSLDTLQALWDKAPTRVRGMADQGFPLPRQALLG